MILRHISENTEHFVGWLYSVLATMRKNTIMDRVNVLLENLVRLDMASQLGCDPEIIRSLRATRKDKTVPIFQD